MKIFGSKKKKFLLDFIIVGAQKAGTSALDYYLRKHPSIEMARKKELHFFDNEEIFSKNRVDFSAIEENYIHKNPQMIFGEATPIYMYWHKSVERIKKYNPHCKLIVILRNPTARAYSHYNMEVLKKKEEDDFYNCIINEEKRILQISSESRQHRVISYKTRGLYYHQLQRLFDNFPKDQVLVLKYEDFLAYQKDHLIKVFEFLGVDTRVSIDIEEKKIYHLPYQKSISERAKAYLIDFYLEDIQKVEKLLGWNCNDWKS